jgi:hypothetical protein
MTPSPPMRRATQPDTATRNRDEVGGDAAEREE